MSEQQQVHPRSESSVTGEGITSIEEARKILNHADSQADTQGAESASAANDQGEADKQVPSPSTEDASGERPQGNRPGSKTKRGQRKSTRGSGGGNRGQNTPTGNTPSAPHESAEDDKAGSQPETSKYSTRLGSLLGEGDGQTVELHGRYDRKSIVPDYQTLEEDSKIIDRANRTVRTGHRLGSMPEQVNQLEAYLSYVAPVVDKQAWRLSDETAKRFEQAIQMINKGEFKFQELSDEDKDDYQALLWELVEDGKDIEEVEADGVDLGDHEYAAYLQKRLDLDNELRANGVKLADKSNLPGDPQPKPRDKPARAHDHNDDHGTSRTDAGKAMLPDTMQYDSNGAALIEGQVTSNGSLRYYYHDEDGKRHSIKKKDVDAYFAEHGNIQELRDDSDKKGWEVARDKLGNLLRRRRAGRKLAKLAAMSLVEVFYAPGTLDYEGTTGFRDTLKSGREQARQVANRHGGNNDTNTNERRKKRISRSLMAGLVAAGLLTAAAIGSSRSNNELEGHGTVTEAGSSDSVHSNSNRQAQLSASQELSRQLEATQSTRQLLGESATAGTLAAKPEMLDQSQLVKTQKAARTRHVLESMTPENTSRGLKLNLANIRPGDYPWNVMDRAGDPDGRIMHDLTIAGQKYHKATGKNVTWHGQGKHRWIEVDGQSGTKSVLKQLKPYL